MLKDGPLWALGAMSGTSLDGIDAAMLRTDGVDILEFGETRYRPYSKEEQTVLRAALGKWGDVEPACEIIETAHAETLSRFEGANLVGFHGQTLAHDPRGRGTFQAGSGAILAEVLDLPVVSDFRSADVKLGGEGAPLAPFFHFACARWIGAADPLCVLNLGGVGNITWINPQFQLPEETGALLAFDTGPANAPINDLMLQRLGQGQDQDGALAAQGVPDATMLARFVEDSYFYKIPPKSLDRNDFALLGAMVRDMGDADACATLTACVAASVVKAMEHCPVPPARVLVTGGGRHNKTLMAMLGAGLDCPLYPVEVVGLNGDMLEAQAFAYLAVRVARGLPTSCRSTTGVPAAISGGDLNMPSPR